MYVCICNNLTDKDIKEKMTGDEKTSEDVLAKHQTEHVCGTCAQHIKSLINEHKNDKSEKDRS